MQVGNAGGQFIAMTTTSKGMYDYAMNTLRSAKKVKVHYAEGFMRNVFAADTNYVITKIELPDDI